MPNYAVGDIQGCFLEFKEGLELIKFDTSQDFLWITGDLINKGPDSLKVLKYVYANRKSMHLVLGNHDLHFLNCFFNKRPIRKEDTFDSLMKYKKVIKLANYLLNQPFVFSKKIFIDKKIQSVGMVHAGIPMHMSLKKIEILSRLIKIKLLSSPRKYLKSIFKNEEGFSEEFLVDAVNFFTRARVVKRNGKPDFSYKGNRKNIAKNSFPWFDKKLKLMEDLDYLVFGHWAALEGKTSIENIRALDTGCCWGKELTFLRLEDQKEFKVQSKQK